LATTLEDDSLADAPLCLNVLTATFYCFAVLIWRAGNAGQQMVLGLRMAGITNPSVEILWLVAHGIPPVPRYFDVLTPFNLLAGS